MKLTELRQKIDEFIAEHGDCEAICLHTSEDEHLDYISPQVSFKTLYAVFSDRAR